MQTGMISFCDRIAMNIKSNEVKNVILQELENKFHVRILQKHWHKTDEVSLSHIRANPHFVSLRSNGNPYYMYFTQHEDVPIIYFIDKKVASGYTYPRIILGRGLFHPDVFKNTLLEGEMVKRGDGGWTFLINDMFAYHNQWLENYHLPYRLTYAMTLFQKEHTPDPVLDPCRYEIKRYLPTGPNTIQELFAFASTLSYTNRGLYFWPTIMKQKPKLFNFDESLILQVKPKIKEVTEFRLAPNPSPPTPPSPPSPPSQSSQPAPVVSMKPGARTLFLQKTEFPDVFNVWDESKKNKLGVAHVPNLRTSKMLHDVFKMVNVVTYIPFVCELSPTGKWVPLSQHAN